MKIHYIVYSCTVNEAYNFIDSIKTGKVVKMAKEFEWREYYSDHKTSERIAIFDKKTNLLKVYMKYVPVKNIMAIEEEIKL